MACDEQVVGTDKVAKVEQLRLDSSSVNCCLFIEIEYCNAGKKRLKLGLMSVGCIGTKNANMEFVEYN